jgi:WhiB family redox-sensing transcriptional regulator
MTTTDPEEEFYVEIVSRLDWLAPVPDEVLCEIVTRDGACMVLADLGELPEWTGTARADRALAAWICGGCPVRLECLELELRTAGGQAVGVWGALPADEVRALYPLWRAHRADSTGEADGGQR